MCLVSAKPLPNTMICHHGNFLCRQWRQIGQCDDVSILLLYFSSVGMPSECNCSGYYHSGALSFLSIHCNSLEDRQTDLRVPTPQVSSSGLTQGYQSSDFNNGHVLCLGPFPPCALRTMMVSTEVMVSPLISKTCRTKIIFINYNINMCVVGGYILKAIIRVMPRMHHKMVSLTVRGCYIVNL